MLLFKFKDGIFMVHISGDKATFIFSFVDFENCNSLEKGESMQCTASIIKF